MRAVAVGLTRQQKVDHIVGLMERGEWLRGRTGPVLAREWGDDPSTVRNYAAEAFNVLKREVQDPELVKQDVATVLQQALHRAMEAGKFRDAVAAGDVLTRILGARAPERTQEVPVNPEEAAKRWKELTGQDWKPKE